MTKRRTREEETESAARSTSRRSFAKTLAAAVLAAPATAASVRAQTTPTPTPAQQTPQPSPVAAAYTEIARLRFGEHLSAEQLESVQRDLEGNVRTAERLRAYKLNNSDEPDFVFDA